MIPYLIAGAIGFVVAKIFDEDEAPKYDDGGSVLLAPNGKPSNLTPEQYKLVRTPEFKAWFGDWENDPANASKVVDENGEPLPVYHGTNNDFNVFDVEETRFNYLYFAVNKEYAEKFGKVKSYFINANKIKDVTRVGIKNITTDNAYGVLGWKIEPAHTYGKQKFWIHLKESDEIYRTFKYNNYNAIKFIEDFTDDGSYIETEAFAIINPSIIKLADGTNTTFDGSNPDIRYAGGGDVEGKNYINTIRNCLIAQNYSDSAKGIEMYDYELHYKQINKIWSNNRLSFFQMKDLLYEDKNKFIERAISSAKKTNIKIIIGLDEKGYNVIYFEFPFGQVSFHLMIDEDKLDVLLKKYKNIIYNENYKWSGFTNSMSLLMNEWKKIQPNENNFEIGGVSELLAPNGKPSKLTPEQYKLVREPAFKEWFGDWENDPENSSKVIDEETKEPLVVYHGTNNNFNKFDLKYFATNTYLTGLKGFYFAKNKNIANRYGSKIKTFFIGKGKLLFNSPKMVVTDNPNQIKLADGTNTNFDGGNSDIRFDDGGSLEEGNNNVLEYLFNNTEDITPIKINGRTVGGIDVTTYRGDTETLRVHKMLILPEFQGKGIGAKAINKLFRENPNVKQIIGNATAESKSFWQKIGAEFHSNEHTAFTITRNPDIIFDNGGTTMKAPKLLAPNGKPSKLTPEQYKLVRTPEFKAWFGDWENSPETSSKVIDEETKEPLVVYHGSNIDFNVFEKSKTNPYAEKQGYFFAISKKYAESYNSKYVKPFFINIRIKGTFDDDDNLVPFNADGNIVQGLQVEVYDKNNIKLADGTNTTFDGSNPDIRFDGGGDIKKVKFNIESKEGEEDRTTISIKGIGEVVLVETFPEYEFLEDIGEDGLEELGVEEGDMIGKIEHLEINDKYKGKGYAKLLMNKAIEVAKEKGLMPLYLNASPMGSKRYGLNIEDLTGFYQTFGFEVFLEQGNNNLMILKDSNNPDIRFDEGGDTKLNVDRYREIEKEMFELRKQGKGDTLEYFKLIKERSIL